MHNMVECYIGQTRVVIAACDNDDSEMTTSAGGTSKRQGLAVKLRLDHLHPEETWLLPKLLSEDCKSSIGLRDEVHSHKPTMVVTLQNHSGIPTVLHVSRVGAATHIVRNVQQGAVRHRHRSMGRAVGMGGHSLEGNACC